MTTHRGSQPTQIDTRQRLIEQNKKLRSQIIQLAGQVDEIIQKKGATAVKKQHANSNQFEDKKKELKNQQHYIGKLKGKINELKNSVIFGSDSLARKEEDKVTILKRELRGLEEEKATLQKLKHEKTRVLKDRDQPHGHLKDQLQQLTTSVRSDNKELLERCMALQKQIRREHQMSVTSKQAIRQNGKDSGNYEHLLPGLEAEIRQAEEQKKSIESKWNPKIEYLDTQMLQLRTLFDSKKRRLDDLMKQVKNWQIRKYVYRDEDSIKEVKDRLAKLPVKPRSQTNTSKNSKATSMSMMESKPDQTHIIRRSTSKEKFRDFSPPSVLKADDAPTKVIEKTFLLGKHPSKEIVQQPKELKKPRKQPNDQKEVKPQTKKPIKEEPVATRKQIQQQTALDKPKAQGSMSTPSAPQIPSAAKYDSKRPLQQQSKKPARDAVDNQALKNFRGAAATSADHRNEFMEEVQSYPLSSGKQQKKEKKLLKSIAIGTTFYYNGD